MTQTWITRTQTRFGPCGLGLELVLTICCNYKRSVLTISTDALYFLPILLLPYNSCFWSASHHHHHSGCHLSTLLMRSMINPIVCYGFSHFQRCSKIQIKLCLYILHPCLFWSSLWFLVIFALLKLLQLFAEVSGCSLRRCSLYFILFWWCDSILCNLVFAVILFCWLLLTLYIWYLS